MRVMESVFSIEDKGEVTGAYSTGHLKMSMFGNHSGLGLGLVRKDRYHCICVFRASRIVQSCLTIQSGTLPSGKELV